MDSFQELKDIESKKEKKVFRFFSWLKVFKKKKNSNGHIQTELDKKLVYSLSASRFPSLKQLKYIGRYLNPKEKWLMRISLVLIVLSFLVLGTNFYLTHLVEVPIAGGANKEALVGAPKYINPLYANLSDVDNDISRLVFSSLFIRGKEGELVNDLVEDYEISEDKKIYTFTIRKNVLFHDGNELTANDIVFTFNAIKNIQYKSTLRASFSGVEIEKIDDYKIRFILIDPYVAFLNLLTFGIMPADVWSQVSPESAAFAGLNIKPIGSGPYRLKEYAKDEKTGVIKEYILEINQDYYGEKPLVNISFEFFNDFNQAINALNDNQVDSISYLPSDLASNIIKPKTLQYYKLSLSQMNVVFFNTKANVALSDIKVRQALAYGLDKNEIVGRILGADAQAVDGPILPYSFAYNQDIKKYGYNTEEAKKLLDEAGWKEKNISVDDLAKAEEEISSADEKIRQAASSTLSLGSGAWRVKDGNFLSIYLVTSDRDENQQVVQAVADYWQKLGLKVRVDIFPISQIQSAVIKPRNFDALFFGQIIGIDPDPYGFWHSSQTGENRFNVAGFVNEEVDTILEEARLLSDQDVRKEKYIKFQDIIAEEVPAIFMYSPFYTYVQSNKLKGFDVKSVIYPSDRFANVNQWYINTGKKLQW